MAETTALAAAEATDRTAEVAEALAEAKAEAWARTLDTEALAATLALAKAAAIARNRLSAVRMALTEAWAPATAEA